MQARRINGTAKNKFKAPALAKLSQKKFYIVFSLLIAAVFFQTAPFSVKGETAKCGIKDSRPRLPENMGAYRSLEKGEFTYDTDFGCKITRLTDAKKEGKAFIQHQYSSVNPFNADSSRVMTVTSDGIVQIRDLQGNIVRNNLFQSGILPLGDPLWSRIDPDLIYFHPADSAEIKSYRVSTGQTTALASLSGYSKISFGNGEGDISHDGKHIPILADGRYALLYDIEKKSFGGPVDALRAPQSRIDVIDAAGNGKIWLMDSILKSVSVADTAGTRQLIDYQGHSDRGKDANGAEISVITNSNDRTPIPNCSNGIVKVDNQTGKETCLLGLDWSLAVHISCNNTGQGWCVVSTYSANTPGGSWPSYSNEIFSVSLSTGEAVRLAHSRSLSTDYQNMPRAAVSGDGRHILFDSDSGSGTADVYLITLSENQGYSSSGQAPVPPAETGNDGGYETSLVPETKRSENSAPEKNIEVNPAQTGRSEPPPVPFVSGGLYKASGDPTVFVILDDLARYAFKTAEEFLSLGYRFGMIKTVSTAEIRKHEESSSEILPAHPSNTFIKYPGNPTVYRIENGYKRGIPSMDVLSAYTDINMVTDAPSYFFYPAGEALGYPDGVLLKGSGLTVYLMEKGVKRPFSSYAAFSSRGFRENEILLVNESNLNVNSTGFPLN